MSYGILKYDFNFFRKNKYVFYYTNHKSNIYILSVSTYEMSMIMILYSHFILFYMIRLLSENVFFLSAINLKRHSQMAIILKQ